ncbi:unnamed protein product [Dovyalis caffra]|uniref:Uncharacterized protein n=1 Tax=Dovyalis caffra TaxID=77055 RepID=A0AAV1R6Y8_9ROSI|nr:unnamed protein product [Dovyalis caffra]
MRRLLSCPSLEELIIKHSVDCIFLFEDDDDDVFGGGELVPSSRLQSLQIQGCDMLTYVPDGLYRRRLHSLVRLKIYECRSLRKSSSLPSERIRPNHIALKLPESKKIASCALRRERQFYCCNDGDGKKCGQELCSCVYHGPTNSKAMRLGLDRDREAVGHGLVERSRRGLDAKEAQKSGCHFRKIVASDVSLRGGDLLVGSLFKKLPNECNNVMCFLIAFLVAYIIVFQRFGRGLSELKDPTDKVALVDLVSATLVIVGKDVVEDCTKCLKLVALTLRLLPHEIAFRVYNDDDDDVFGGGELVPSSRLQSLQISRCDKLTSLPSVGRRRLHSLVFAELKDHADKVALADLVSPTLVIIREGCCPISVEKNRQSGMILNRDEETVQSPCRCPALDFNSKLNFLLAQDSASIYITPDAAFELRTTLQQCKVSKALLMSVTVNYTIDLVTVERWNSHFWQGTNCSVRQYVFRMLAEEIDEMLLSFAEAGVSVVRLKGGDPLDSVGFLAALRRNKRVEIPEMPSSFAEAGVPVVGLNGSHPLLRICPRMLSRRVITGIWGAWNLEMGELRWSKGISVFEDDYEDDDVFGGGGELLPSSRLQSLQFSYCDKLPSLPSLGRRRLHSLVRLQNIMCPSLRNAVNGGGNLAVELVLDEKHCDDELL